MTKSQFLQEKLKRLEKNMLRYDGVTGHTRGLILAHYESSLSEAWDRGRGYTINTEVGGTLTPN